MSAKCTKCDANLPAIACPDKKKDCAILHLGECPECAKAKPRVWLTTHVSSGGKPAVAAMTLNNIGFNVRFEEKFDGVGIQAGLGPMRIEEWALIRDALNRYWVEHVNDICGAPSSYGLCQDRSGEYHGH